MTYTPLTMEALTKALLHPRNSKAMATLREHPSIKRKLKSVWMPQEGPQSAAYYSEADELLYGGAAGGGKTDLLIGLALTQHQISVLYRRQATDLDDLWSRLAAVAAPIKTKDNAVKKVLMTVDKRVIFGGHLELPGSEKSAQGRARDFYGFDEGAQLDEFKVEFVTRWNRSTTGNRCRVVIATNPPIPEMVDGVLVDNGSGDWLMRWFAPWLDDRFPDPADQGELRWCYMKREGDRLVTIWVDGPGTYDIETGLLKPDATEDDIYGGKVTVARSRTFIRSLLKDNVFLRNSGYAQRMASTPEPLKSMLLLGSFTVRPEDHPFQVVPTNWVLAAQDRWIKREAEIKKLPMLVLSVDIAQGGAATTVMAPLYETDIFGELVKKAGRETPTGDEVEAMLLRYRTDNAMIVLDGTGGWAGSTRDILRRDHSIEPEMCVASEGSTEWTEDMRYRFLNVRTAMWWGFRLALDPKNEFEIALPPDHRLLAQLTTPHFKYRGNVIIVESKEDVMKRLQGASTDEADSVIQAWRYRENALAAKIEEELSWKDRVVEGRTPEDVRAERRRNRHRAQDLENPLKDW